MARREWEKNSQPFPHTSNPSLLQTPWTTTTTRTNVRDVKPAPPWTSNDATMYAVVQGFIQGFQDNMQDAVESRLYQNLDHISFGFDNVWPKEFLDEIKSHCSLDVQAIKEGKAHFARSWDRLNKTQPKIIKRFGLRLTQEQDSLRRDSVIISDKDILEHYLLEVYQSRAFSNKVIRMFKQLG